MDRRKTRIGLVSIHVPPTIHGSFLSAPDGQGQITIIRIINFDDLPACKDAQPGQLLGRDNIII